MYFYYILDITNYKTDFTALGNKNILDKFIIKKVHETTFECEICSCNMSESVSCFRCKKMYCCECFNNLKKLSCPFCNYTLTEHKYVMTKILYKKILGN